ncbi:hypothetical protein HGRIS_011726 [Hohenbuehelia grisea]|uniref:Uncharacterized protein n=1 Tax=Hohenbuehelia grisea TaxID=104357 RepID=A0ABR3JX25_9AGAR
MVHKHTAIIFIAISFRAALTIATPILESTGTQNGISFAPEPKSELAERDHELEARRFRLKNLFGLGDIFTDLLPQPQSQQQDPRLPPIAFAPPAAPHRRQEENMHSAEGYLSYQGSGRRFPFYLNPGGWKVDGSKPPLTPHAQRPGGKRPPSKDHKNCNAYHYKRAFGNYGRSCSDRQRPRCKLSASSSTNGLPSSS